MYMRRDRLLKDYYRQLHIEALKQITKISGTPDSCLHSALEWPKVGETGVSNMLNEIFF